MDLNDIAESFRRGLQEIPPVLLGLALLGGPTVALIVWRFFGMARRMRISADVKATPFWVCQDCRSINEMRLARCYRCGFQRASTREVEILIDRPGYRPVPLVLPTEAAPAAPAASAAPAAPAASAAPGASAEPVASLARAARGRKSAGKPVMAQAADVDPVAVGPGHEAGAAPGGAPTIEEAGAAVEAES